MSPATAPFEGWDPALPSGFCVSLAVMELEGATQRSIDDARRPVGWPQTTGGCPAIDMWGVTGGQVFTLMDFKLKSQRGLWLPHGTAQPRSPLEGTSRRARPKFPAGRGPELPALPLVGWRCFLSGRHLL